MAEGHRAVMGESALDQHMTVKSSHLRNGENSDTSEGTGSHRQHLAVGNVGPQLIVRGALQPEESDVAGHNVAFQRTLVTSWGRLLDMISWYFMAQEVSLPEVVFPQWKPMKVSFWV